jgi:hypothetical protein
MYRISTFLLSLVLVLYLAANAQANLVGHWQFEGNFNDSSGNGNDATAHGDAAIVNDPERGQVAILDGNGDYIEIPHSNSLNIIGEQISLAAWVYFDDVSGPPEIIIAKVFNNTTHTSPYFSYGLHILTNGQPRFWQSLAGGAANIPAPSGQFFQSERWYHLAGVYDGSAMTLYINGQAVAVRNVSGAINGYDSLLRLGTNGGLTEQMSGKLDDVRIYSRAMSAEQVRNLFNGTAPSWLQAQDPVPADGAIHSGTWVNLSWLPGDNAVSHDVYLGENFDDVNIGAEGTFQGNHAGTFLVVGFPGFPYPDGLVPGTTYYWRIDEVNDNEPDSPCKGNIWSFSIPSRTAYNPNPADGAESIGVDVRLSWTAGFDAKVHTVYFGENYDEVNNAAGGLPLGTATYNPGPLKAGKTYYWRVDEFDIIETHKGEVWSFTTEGAVASLKPSNGAVDVMQTQILTWSPSDNAASHEVYFGTDKEAVRDADKASPEYKGVRALGSESYDPGKLEWDTTYYWRIDEVNNAHPDSPWIGPVWSFTTANFLIVDDFEDYDAGENQIWYAWKDGLGYGTPGTAGYFAGNGSGSAVGDENTPSYTEETIVHGGNQAMPMAYDNNKQGFFKYSEAELTLTYPRDWTENGVSILTIWFRGDSANAAETLYVALNGSAVVSNDDPAAAQVTTWTEWNIDLQGFADQGVNLANVNTIALGLGNKNNPLAGGSGTMYFDDIRLYPPLAP